MENPQKFISTTEIKIIVKDPLFNLMCSTVRDFLSANVREYKSGGQIVRGYRSPDSQCIWLRDHTHQMKAVKYFDNEVKSTVDYFIQHQRENGSFYDFVDPAGENVRCEIEADIEYLMVEAVHCIWQATGDDEWMISQLGALEHGMKYSMTNPDRWSKKYNLVKRPFTIDTWDFEYNNDPYVKTNTKWCIMHGDNSGMFCACRLLAKMMTCAGRPENAVYWEQRAEDFKRNTNKYCWNGRFYTHQVHIDPVVFPGVDESEQLSLSNTYDINRGICSHEQAVSIIKEYQHRRELTKATHFAEWFSINPCFPRRFVESGWTTLPGHYVNGGIFPFVGGELARACFEHGFETYGVDILKRYCELAINGKKSYLWYHPDGTPGIRPGSDTLATDGWGSGAMLYAFIEGLTGIEDTRNLFQDVKLSPRWIAAGETDVFVMVTYPSSGSFIAYQYQMNKNGKSIYMKISGTGNVAKMHLLLPQGSKVIRVKVGREEINYSYTKVRDSLYVDFKTDVRSQRIFIELL